MSDSQADSAINHWYRLRRELQEIGAAPATTRARAQAALERCGIEVGSSELSSCLAGAEVMKIGLAHANLSPDTAEYACFQAVLRLLERERLTKNLRR